MGKENVSDEVVDLFGDIVDIASDIAELIPVVGPILKSAKIYRSIRDQLFLSKTKLIFEEMDRASKADMAAFVENLKSDDKLHEFGTNILFLIDKMDDLEKPVIVGRLFRAAIEKKLKLETAKRIASLVNGVYSPDLKSLWEFRHESIGKNPDVSATLETAGFLRAVSEDWGNVAGVPSGTTVTYTLNQYGRDLLEFGMSPN
ncbi:MULTISPECIES: hypothetical protein [unclassified Rhizobium]|uniref:hypothetical protein n=1 Tax=unclassified Rhizobium TaxID=2613769 RepID=UPI001614BC28|nr:MULTISPECIES: hypothetical protein [unclassified Rhizobium]MBB3286683.1 hypothetical protein [Rhizobium sp. BK252]MBB3401123.1 hypothetical protein [Rhizobium sp. BK289]MBB3413701.1 hypothetical protein [Rhizobium sp. BK284]MBB3481588.1 hypothetical protein [Rhizobium sp. BK347]